MILNFQIIFLGFVFFVANLKKHHYKFQFTQLSWTHMTLLIVVFQSHFIINNIFEGLIWYISTFNSNERKEFILTGCLLIRFVLPVSLVICNDIFAYICGFFWGRTPLIKLSPKKTWEGFVGALICTIIFGFFVSNLYIICLT